MTFWLQKTSHGTQLSVQCEHMLNFPENNEAVGKLEKDSRGQKYAVVFLLLLNGIWVTAECWILVSCRLQDKAEVTPEWWVLRSPVWSVRCLGRASSAPGHSAQIHVTSSHFFVVVVLSQRFHKLKVPSNFTAGSPGSPGSHLFMHCHWVGHVTFSKYGGLSTGGPHDELLSGN